MCHPIAPARPANSPWERLQVARLGFSATLVGIGLARFAYTPMLPALVVQGWFDEATAAYLGAANLLGYLIGALTAPEMARRNLGRGAIQLALVGIVASFFACAFPLGFAWYFGWRFVSGLGGGVLMVLAVSLLMPSVDPAWRGRIGGAIFAGVGAGVLVSATVVPALLEVGVPSTWWALGMIAAFWSVLGWSGWPSNAAVEKSHDALASKRVGMVPGIIWVYGLVALGLVPAMVFLADFIARGLGAGDGWAALNWAAFALGALIGPLAAGWVGDRWTFRAALGWALFIEILVAAVFAWVREPMILLVPSLLVGAFVPGVVPLVVGNIHCSMHADEGAKNRLWSRASVTFAACQAFGGYACAALYHWADGDHATLFQASMAILVLALITHLTQCR